MKYLKRQPKILYLDNNGAEVARFHRPFKTTCRCFTCFCPCCLQEMEITSGGAIIGYIIQIQARESIIFYRSKLTKAAQGATDRIIVDQFSKSVMPIRIQFFSSGVQ